MLSNRSALTPVQPINTRHTPDRRKASSASLINFTITQDELVAYDLYRAKMKANRREFKELQAGRNQIRDRIIQKLKSGGTIQAGAHVAWIGSVVNLFVA